MKLATQDSLEGNLVCYKFAIRPVHTSSSVLSGSDLPAEVLTRISDSGARLARCQLGTGPDAQHRDQRPQVVRLVGPHTYCGYGEVSIPCGAEEADRMAVKPVFPFNEDTFGRIAAAWTPPHIPQRRP